MPFWTAQSLLMGDRVMEHHRLAIYNGASMLEPFVTERLSELARAYRPRIPVDPRYRNHVDEKMRIFWSISAHYRSFVDAMSNTKPTSIGQTDYYQQETKKSMNNIRA